MSSSTGTDRAWPTGAWYLGVFLATAAGFMVRFAGLSTQSFWYDEAYSANITKNGSAADIFSGQRKDNGNPPLYYVLHKWAVDVFGADDAGQRTLSALAGVLAVPLIGLFARRVADGGSGLTAAWLMAISPLQVELSNEARVYSLLHLIVIASSLVFVHWVSAPRWSTGLAYCAVTLAGCYSHYYYVFIVISQFVVIVCHPERGKLLGRWFLLMCAAALLWSPWAPAFVDQLRTPGNLSRIADSWKMQFASTPVTFGVGRTFAWRDAGPLGRAAAAVVTLVGFCAPAVIGCVREWRSNRPYAMLLSGGVLFPVLFPLVVAIALTPIYHHRYASVGMPAFVVLVAIGISTLPRTSRVAVVAVIATGTAYSLLNYYSKPIKDDWRAATAAILSQCDSSCPILIDEDTERVSFEYYATRGAGPPADVYGLKWSAGHGELRAVRFRAGSRIDPEPVDYSDRIFAAHSVCLALCMPARPLEYYRRVFEDHGFRVVTEEHFFHITLLSFKRGSP